ncbi:FUSC family protein [Streptomyces sp. NPDC102451]|uniref:FUSC family protein n=1 Tax=Streptomyces sp. NPDC102451 TaxID=3366177 RepID=UPI0037F57CC8
MPFLRRLAPAAVRRGRRRSAADVRRVLHPRGALVLHDVDGALVFALRAALAMGLVAVPVVLAGRPDLAVYAMLGSFTTTFGRNLPYARRARVLALVALAMTACVACGSALAAWARPEESAAGAAVVVAATALVAGAAKFVCDATRLSGLGAIMVLFSFAVAAHASPAPADILPYTAMAAAGAAPAWLLGMLGLLIHPDRPQRLAVATALREVAALLEARAAGAEVPGRTRHRATVAVLDAYRSLGQPPPARRAGRRHDTVLLPPADLSWALLVGAERWAPGEQRSAALYLRGQARLLTGRRHGVPPAPGTPPSGEAGLDGSRLPAGPGRTRAPSAVLRATELLLGRPHGPHHRAVLAVPALRMALGTGVAGGLAVLLGLEHSYWAAISAAAVLHSVNVRTTAQRAVQRTLGTVVGLLLALGVLAAEPGPVALAVVIVALEFLLEYIVVRNYALGVVFLTPMALLLSDLAAPAPAGELILDRALGSVMGIAVGLLCALLVLHDQAAMRVERALEACLAAAEDAERSLVRPEATPRAVVRLRLAEAVVELREADDNAAGEVWPAEIDPSELAAAEQRAYTLLGRLDLHL